MTITVLHLLKGLGPGGAEHLVLGQVAASDNADVRYLAAHLVPRKNQLVPSLENHGAKVTCLDADDPRDPRWLARLRQLILAEQVDVIHGHSPLVAAQVRPMLRTLSGSLRPSMVYTEHNQWGRHVPVTRNLNRATIALEDRVFAVSQAVKDSMRPAFNRRVDISVLRHGVDVEAVSNLRFQHTAVRDELGLEPRNIVIGTVANFRHEKGYDIMLEAAAKAIAQDPDLRFVSVGQGPLVDEIVAHRDRLGLGDRFDLLGYRADATRVMSAFDIFTLASRHEGLPVALMDAMALGLPVVATNVGGIREAATSEVARLVKSGDVAGLASAWVAAADDERWRVDASRAALERSADFDIRTAVRTLESTYQELVDSR